ncbi:MAG: DNA repair protein RecO [Bacteroidales bacterium]|nr:DNA repair protein RecO [Bacteroidales bacterium]
MLFKTRGIVLHHIKYSETSVIVTIYTELFGRQSYIINGVRGKKSKIKANILQSLFLLNMEVYHKPKQDLQRVKEAQPDFVFSSLPYDIRKSTLAIFIAEILYKTIQEHEANAELFNYLYNSIQVLDLKEKGISNFHLYFLIHLTKYLGFFPENNYSDSRCYFDLKAGRFMQIKPMHLFFIGPIESKILNTLFEFSENQHENVNIRHKERIEILEKILDYYSLHIDGISTIKSLSILREVFH